jgi:hypothetical protein
VPQNSALRNEILWAVVATPAGTYQHADVAVDSDIAEFEAGKPA